MTIIYSKSIKAEYIAANTESYLRVSQNPKTNEYVIAIG